LSSSTLRLTYQWHNLFNNPFPLYSCNDWQRSGWILNF
jgi:hypothetical protein